MITISEKPTKKMPGFTSLFITFDYNIAIIEALKTIPSMMYHKSLKAWETPLSQLSEVVDKLCGYDSITVNWLPDAPVKETQSIKLSKYKTTPFPYQLDAIKYGLIHDKWLLLDAPGLGKSLDLIYLAQELKKREKIQHCLVICGVNTLKTNWKKEIEKHSDLTVRILGERTRKNGKKYIGSVKDRVDDLNHPIKEFMVVSNIETFRNPEIIEAINNEKHNKFDMIVVDEIHTCKSPTSQQGKNLLKLTKAKYKIGATGTLLMNNPSDCYVPLKWIDAERSTLTNFNSYYVVYGGPFHNEIVGYKNIQYLQDQLSAVSVRRTKDILDLPPKTIIHELVDANDAQQKFYDNIVDGIAHEVDKVDLNPACVLGMITRLRQATACPSILTTTPIESAKISRACDLTDQICSDPSNKVVIFTTFKQTANEIYSKLSHLSPLLNTGDVADVEISENIETFQKDNKHKVFVATWAKCGTGITLTRASYMIFVDCAWTEAQNSQSEDRIYRIGSKNPVFIYYLWTKGTIDERVKDIVETKSVISNYVIDKQVPQVLIDKLRELILDLRDNPNLYSN